MGIWYVSQQFFQNSNLKVIKRTLPCIWKSINWNYTIKTEFWYRYLHHRLRSYWYSTDNFSDPQSSLVTQQQAVWQGPRGGWFGLGSRGNRRRVDLGSRFREKEKDVISYGCMSHPGLALVSTLSNTGAVRSWAVSEWLHDQKEEKLFVSNQKRKSTECSTLSFIWQLAIP